MREICQSGLTRGEAAYAPPLLYWSPCFILVENKEFDHESNESHE